MSEIDAYESLLFQYQRCTGIPLMDDTCPIVKFNTYFCKFRTTVTLFVDTDEVVYDIYYKKGLFSNNYYIKSYVFKSSETLGAINFPVPSIDKILDLINTRCLEKKCIETPVVVELHIPEAKNYGKIIFPTKNHINCKKYKNILKYLNDNS